MVEYLVSVIAVSASLGFITYLSYPGASERAVKFAVSVLLIYTVATPILSFVLDFSEGGALEFIEEIKEKTDEELSTNNEYLKVTEEALKDGISKLIFTEYGVSEENIEVYIFNFDFEKMRAGKINVVLSGKGALADTRGMEEYLNKLNIGKCEVKIRLG